MTTRLTRTLPIAALLMGLLATPAFAKGHRGHSHNHRSHHSSYRHHGGHRYYGHHGSRYYHRPSVSFGFYSGPAYAYAPYYAPPPAVVYREPVYVGTPAVANVEVQVQRELARRGYYGGVIDGAIGGQTRAAIRAYQVDKGLPVSGRIDGNLLRSLRLL